MKEDFINILTKNNIRPTADRLLIYETLFKVDGVFCLADIELILDTVDRSTIFRTLELFNKKNIIHEFDDGSGSKKYCLCTCSSSDHYFNHIHFTCIKCHKTICLKDQDCPNINLPQDYNILQVSSLIKGICPQCKKTYNL